MRWTQWGMPEHPPTDDLAGLLLSQWSGRGLMRTFKPDPVPDRAVSDMERAAMAGPRVGDPARERLVFVSDPGLRAELGDALCKGLNRINFWVRSAPLIIMALSRQAMVDRLRSIDGERFDLIQALERIASSAQTHGLGSCPVLGFDGREVKRVLSAREGWRVVAALAVGYPGLTGEEVFGISVISDFHEYYHRLRERLDRRAGTARDYMVVHNRFRHGRKSS